MILEALLEGKTTPEQMAKLAQKKARLKTPEIVESLQGHRLSAHHRLLVEMSLEVRRCLETQIRAIDDEVLKRIEQEGYSEQLRLLESIPGDSAGLGQNHFGGNRSPDAGVFPTPAHLSSWAGVCPGNKQSAGKDFRGHTPVHGTSTCRSANLVIGTIRCRATSYGLDRNTGPPPLAGLQKSRCKKICGRNLS